MRMAGVATWLAAVVGARVPTRTTAAGVAADNRWALCPSPPRHTPYHDADASQTRSRRDPALLRPDLHRRMRAIGDDGGVRVCLPAPELAWISNYTNRWPKAPQLAAISRIAPLLQGPALRFADARLAPRPGEGHRAWDVICTAGTARRNGPLMERDVTEVDRRRAEALRGARTSLPGARRFVNKNTRNSRRIRYLAELFPDAYFLHVMRDPRAVIASLLKVGFCRSCLSGGRRTRRPARWRPTARRARRSQRNAALGRRPSIGSCPTRRRSIPVGTSRSHMRTSSQIPLVRSQRSSHSRT